MELKIYTISKFQLICMLKDRIIYVAKKRQNYIYIYTDMEFRTLKPVTINTCTPNVVSFFF